MIRKSYLTVLTLALATALGGCYSNAAAPPPEAAAPPPPPRAAALASLPPGAPCSAKINRYQSVLDADRATGNVEPPVYEAITHEIGEAAAACSAGHSGEALRLVRSSEDRHGYHV